MDRAARAVGGALIALAAFLPHVGADGARFPDRALEIGPVPVGLVRLDARECARCHAEQAAQWEPSAHHASFTNEWFQAGFRVDPLPFCRHCHAPRALTVSPLDPGLRAGVDCASCHVRDGQVLATRASPAGRRAHAMRVDPRLRRSDSCASCHQFRFPHASRDAELRYDPSQWMQSTYAEWLASPAAARGTSCADCHGHHAIRGPSDLEWLRDNVELTVTRDVARVHVSIAAPRVGHAVPTGDLFRRLELTITPERGAPRRATFARLFAAARTGRPAPQRWLSEVADLRLRPDRPRSLSVRVPRDVPVRYRLDWLRVPEHLARRQGMDPARAREPVHEGSL